MTAALCQVTVSWVRVRVRVRWGWAWHRRSRQRSQTRLRRRRHTRSRRRGSWRGDWSDRSREEGGRGSGGAEGRKLCRQRSYACF